jgi:uncharacterized membrane protein
MNALLPGMRAALNYHPMFVHFPIALWLAALLFEILAVRRASEDFHRTAARLLYLGTLAGAITALTGWWAADSVPAGAAQRALERHEFLMLTSFSVALGLCLFAFFARKNFTAQYRKVLLIGLVVLAVLLTIGADRGAQLVFQYGSAVNWPSAVEQAR